MTMATMEKCTASERASPFARLVMLFRHRGVSLPSRTHLENKGLAHCIVDGAKALKNDSAVVVRHALQAVASASTVVVWVFAFPLLHLRQGVDLAMYFVQERKALRNVLARDAVQCTTRHPIHGSPKCEVRDS